jgi:hypothetical protein
MESTELYNEVYSMIERILELEEKDKLNNSEVEEHSRLVEEIKKMGPIEPIGYHKSVKEQQKYELRENIKKHLEIIKTYSGRINENWKEIESLLE